MKSSLKQIMLMILAYTPTYALGVIIGQFTHKIPLWLCIVGGIVTGFISLWCVDKYADEKYLKQLIEARNTSLNRYNDLDRLDFNLPTQIDNNNYDELH